MKTEVTYDSEAAAIYIWLKKRKVKHTLRLPQMCEGDIYWINIDLANDSICGIELLLNPDSRLKQILDKYLKEAK